MQTQGFKDFFRSKKSKPKDPKSVAIQRSQLKRRIKEGSFGNTGENALGSRKNKPRLLILILWPSRKRCRPNASIAIRKATMPTTAPSQN